MAQRYSARLIRIEAQLCGSPAIARILEHYAPDVDGDELAAYVESGQQWREAERLMDGELARLERILLQEQLGLNTGLATGKVGDEINAIALY